MREHQRALILSRELSLKRRTKRGASSHARQLLIRETHASIVLQCAARVTAGTECHPYAEGGSPSLHPAVTLVVEFVLAAAQGTAAVLQIADTRHVVARLEDKSIIDRANERANERAANRTVMNSSKSQGMSILSLHCLPTRDAPEANVISCSCGRDDPAPDPSTTSSGLTAAEASPAFPTFVVAVVAVETASPIALDAPWKPPGPIRKESRVQG